MPSTKKLCKVPPPAAVRASSIFRRCAAGLTPWAGATTSVVLSLLCLTPTFGHQGNDMSNYVYDSADETVKSELFGGADNYDSDVLSVDGSLWYAWLEFSPGEGDRIWVGQRRRDWRIRTAVLEYGNYAHPTLTVDSIGRMWLSYECEQDGQWDLYAVRLDAGKVVSVPKAVGSSPGADINHRVAADGNGGIWFAWQTDRNGQFDIVARRVTDDSMGEVETVGGDRHGEWRPAVAIAGDKIHVVWDGYNGNDFDVYIRTRGPHAWGGVKRLAASAAFEARADITVDGRGRAWVAWEEGALNWGKPYRGINTLAMGDQHGPLHRFRLLRIAVQSGERFWRLRDQIPMPSVDSAESRETKNHSVKRTGVFYERPRLLADDAGRIWLVYRHYYTPWLGVEHRSHVEQGWAVYGRYYSASGWSPLMRFDIGQGDGMQRLELTSHANGIAGVWTTGRTHRQPINRRRGIAAAAVAGRGKPVDQPPLVPLPAAEANAEMDVSRQRPVIESGGKTYRLFYGDLHRHTDLSLCRVPFDGTIEDAYRYAIEVARLDFLGITDHSRDIAMGNALSQLWWRSRKQVYRHQLQPEFIPFYAYERSHGNTADHNVISLRSDMLRPHTYPIPRFWKELDRDTITIPHQPIRRDTWSYQHDSLRPLVEIYQGCRDASIEEHVHSGLAKGFHLGFIASSDHLSTSASYACVWAEKPTRESVFRALQARRTYGATTNIELSVLAGEHWMGEMVADSQLSPIELKAKGTAPIRSVKMIVDGKEVETISPNRRDIKLQFKPNLDSGQYVYFHLVQSDGNQAWSSPLWIVN